MDIQSYADLKNGKQFYFSLREVYGSPQRSAAPIWNLQGELLTDNSAMNKRWWEHFKQLLNRSSSTYFHVIEEIPVRPLHMELDGPPTEDEVREAIDELQCGKSAGPDGIPPEVYKAGGQVLIQKFTEFLCTCWEDMFLPQDLLLLLLIRQMEIPVSPMKVAVHRRSLRLPYSLRATGMWSGQIPFLSGS